MTEAKPCLNCKTVIVGAGKIGGQLARALVNQCVIQNYNLLVLEPVQSICQALSQELGVEVISEPNAELSQAQVVILAVKPQDFSALASRLRAHLKADSLIISSMAGVNIERIRAQLGVRSILRCMPNLALMIGQSMTSYVCSRETSIDQKILGAKLLESVGSVLELDSEALMDPATAVAGSGPGYIFYFAEQLILAAQKLGFTLEQAQLLVSQTLLGSALLLKQTPEQVSQLKESVRSKGGTTHAAFCVFDNQQLGQIIQQALNAASERARELAAG